MNNNIFKTSSTSIENKNICKKFVNDFCVIKNNYKTFLVGSTNFNSNYLLSSKINKIIDEGLSTSNSYFKSANSLFADLPLDNEVTAKNLHSTYVRLFQMSLLYSTYSANNTYFKKIELKDRIIEGLEFLYINYFSNTNDGYYGNWFNWEISIPQSITKILLLLEDEITLVNPSLINLYIDKMDNYLRSGKDGDVDLTSRVHTGANLADITFNRIIQGSLLKDENRIIKALKDMMTIFETIDPNNLINGITDGFYNDGSFIQHHRVAYTGSYGKVLLQKSMQTILILSNSKWSNKALIDKMTLWIYKGFSPVIYEGYMMEIVKGRAISRTSTGYDDVSAILESMTQLSMELSLCESNILKSHIKYISNISQGAIDTNSFVSLKSIIDFNHILKDEEILPQNALDDSKHYAFNSMDKTVHIRKDFSFAISRSSNRIAKYEYMNGENLKSWFQGDGFFYLYKSGKNQNDCYGVNYLATIDPYRLPGTTVPNEIRKTVPELYSNNWYDNPNHELNFTLSSLSQNDYVYFPLGTNNYSGGTSIDSYGIAAMQLGDDISYNDKKLGKLPEDFISYKNCTANKSWFMFDEEIVVLGSNICDDLARNVTTTIDNPMALSSEDIILRGKNRFSSDVFKIENGEYKNLEWLSYSSHLPNSNIGYYFPSNKTITVYKGLRTGNLKDIRLSNPSKEITKQFTTLTYDHGKNPQRDTYSYVILPNFNTDMIKDYCKNPKVTILENNEYVHAVKHNDLGIIGYNFFTNNETTVGNVTSLNQGSLIIKKEDHTIKLSVSDPTFSLDKITLILHIPILNVMYTDKEISAILNKDKIEIVVDTKNKYGASFNAVFEVPNNIPV